MREHLADDDGEGGEADAAEGGTLCIDSCGGSAAEISVTTDFFHLPFFVICEERGAGGKDGRERHE